MSLDEQGHSAGHEHIFAYREALRELFNAASTDDMGAFLIVVNKCHTLMNPSKPFDPIHIYRECSDAHSRTVFHFAVLGNNTQLVQYLDSVIPELNYVEDTKDHLIPLMIAVRANYSDIIDYLLNRHPDLLSHRTSVGSTLMHAAVDSQNETVCQKLINQGSEITSFDKDRGTPLYVAIGYIDASIPQMIIEAYQTRHLDVFVAHHPQLMPPALFLAAILRLDNLVKYMLDHGFDPNPIDPQGYSLLHYAAEIGHIQLVQLLIEHNAEINHICNGTTALSLAIQNKQDAIIHILQPLVKAE